MSGRHINHLWYEGYPPTNIRSKPHSKWLRGNSIVYDHPSKVCQVSHRGKRILPSRGKNPSGVSCRAF